MHYKLCTIEDRQESGFERQETDEVANEDRVGCSCTSRNQFGAVQSCNCKQDGSGFRADRTRNILNGQVCGRRLLHEQRLRVDHLALQHRQGLHSRIHVTVLEKQQKGDRSKSAKNLPVAKRKTSQKLRLERNASRTWGHKKNSKVWCYRPNT